MMKGMIKLGATALLVAGLSLGGSALAFPDVPCTTPGQQTTTPVGQGYILWECDGSSWYFLLQYWCDDRGFCIPL